MGFWTLFVLASTPIVQVLIIGLLGAFLASKYCNILTADARRDINKVVFTVFTPALMFASLARTVTFEDIKSWWFMPVNVGLLVFIGAFLGWVVVKIVKPEPQLEGLIIAACSAGNLGNLPLIIVPAACDEDGNLFGDHATCSARGLSYVSFSMALGGFFIWTYTYGIVKKSCSLHANIQSGANGFSEISSRKSNASGEARIVRIESGEVHSEQEPALLPSTKPTETPGSQILIPLLSGAKLSGSSSRPFVEKLKGCLFQITEELMAPPTAAAIIGLIFGMVPWLKSIIIGETAPLRVIQDSITLLGNGTIPCITLILGGNLTEGFKKSVVKPSIIVGIICVKYIILPIIGIFVVNAAGQLGFLAEDPLYRYVLLIQFTVPPAMNIGTMAQLFNMGQQECSVILLWNYLIAALSLTLWSTIFMWILS